MVFPEFLCDLLLLCVLWEEVSISGFGLGLFRFPSHRPRRCGLAFYFFLFFLGRTSCSALAGKRYLLAFVSGSLRGWLVFGSFGPVLGRFWFLFAVALRA